MSRQQSHAQTYGHPEAERSRVEMVHCGRCGAVKEFSFDALGRQRERCPRCEGVARRPGPFDVGAYMPQTALTNAVPSAELEELRAEIERLKARALLPEIELGQLRCQRCAKGVEGTVRFCTECSRSSLGNHKGFRHTPEAIAKIRVAVASRKTTPVPISARIFAPRLCPCGATFIPAHPAQKYHGAECPARSAK